MKDKDKYEVVIWDRSGPRSKMFGWTEKQMLERKDSFELRKLLKDDWWNILFENYTDEHFYLNKKKK